MNTTTIDDLLSRIAHEGKAWTVHLSGKIRLDGNEDDTSNICPLTSLYCRRGRPYYAYQWQFVADQLHVDHDDACALVEVADCALPELIATGARDWQLDLRRRLLHACHLPPEGESDDA